MSEELKQKLLKLKDTKKSNAQRRKRAASIWDINYDYIIDIALKTNNINATYFEKSLLMHAIRINDIDLVLLLLKDGVDVNYQNIHGKTALYCAYDEDKYNIFKLLTEYGADINIPMSNGLSLVSIIKNDRNNKYINLIENVEGIKKEFQKNYEQQETTQAQIIEEDKNKTIEEVFEEAREDFKKVLKQFR